MTQGKTVPGAYTYKYYLLGGVTPVKVTMSADGLRLGAETPDADHGRLIIKTTLLSRIETSPEVEEIGQAQFESCCRRVYARKNAKPSRPGR